MRIRVYGKDETGGVPMVHIVLTREEFDSLCDAKTLSVEFDEIKEALTLEQHMELRVVKSDVYQNESDIRELRANPHWFWLNEDGLLKAQREFDSVKMTGVSVRRRDFGVVVTAPRDAEDLELAFELGCPVVNAVANSPTAAAKDMTDGMSGLPNVTTHSDESSKRLPPE